MRPRLILPVLVGLLSACAGATDPPPAPTFRISPRSIEMAEGRFTSARLSTNLAEHDVIAQINWSYRADSLPTSVAIVQALPGSWPLDVDVHAWAPTAGYIIVQHSYRSLTDSIPLVVHPVSVSAVNFVPESDTIAAGQATDVYGSVEDSSGTRLQRLITWTSSDSTVLAIEYQPDGGFSAGLVRLWGVSPGEAAVSATVEGVTSVFTIVVTEP